MKLVAAILVLVVAGLAFQLHRQQLTIRQQQVRLAELTTKIAVSEANAKSNSRAISANVAFSASDNNILPWIWALRIRFSAARYSFLSRSSWSTVPVM